MKKKVLFALIALMSFVTSWAAGSVVKVGGYDVTLTAKVVELPATGNATAPTATKVTTGSSGNLLKAGVAQTVYKINDEGKLVPAELNEVGNYFLKVTADNTLFVPFMVGKTGDAYFDMEYICNKSTFDASVGNYEDDLDNPQSQHGILFKYYKTVPAGADDMVDNVPAWSAIANNARRSLMFPQINYRVKGLGDNEKWAVYATYQVKNGAETVSKGAYTELENGIPAEYGNKNYWMLSIPQLYADKMPYASGLDDVTGLTIGEGYVLNYKDGETVLKDGITPLTEPSAINDALEADFDWDYVQLYLVSQVDPFKLSVALNSYQTIYAGDATEAPVISSVTFNDVTLQGGYNYTWYDPEGNPIVDGPTAGNSFNNAGAYTLVVTYSNNDLQYTAVAQYIVAPKEITVGATNLYKGYGDPDPTTPDYGTVYSQLGAGDDLSSINIQGLTVLRKTHTDDPTSGAVGEVIPYTIVTEGATAGNPNYTLKVTPVDGNIIVKPKFLGGDEFTFEVKDDNLVYDARPLMPTVTVKRGDVTLEEGTDYEVALYDEDTEDDVLPNNTDATANNEGVRIEGKTAPKIKITGKGNYTSIVTEDAQQTEVPQIEEFDIRQRQIVAAMVSDVADQLFANKDLTPAVTVKFTNGANKEITLVEGADKDYTLTFANNKYVNATNYVPEYTVAAVGNGNYYDTQKKNFNITPFRVVLKPVDGQSKFYGEEDPVGENSIQNKVEAVPADENTQMPEGVKAADIATWTAKRASGEFDGVYTITITDAALIGSQTTTEDPAHNYVLAEVKDGAFMIEMASNYYVSSKNVTREFKSNDKSVPFDVDGFYLYRLDGQQYVEIQATDPLYQEIKESGRITGNELVNPNANVQPASSPFAIQPVIVNSDADAYTIGVLPRNVYDADKEGFLNVTNRVVTIVADDQTSVFGETYKTGEQLTAKVYAGNITKKEDATDDKLISDFILTTANNWNTPNTIGHYTYPTSNIAAKVEDAAKPLTDAVTADIVVTAPQGNPNYDIHVLNGTYTVTASEEKYFIDMTWTKSYGSETITKEAVVKFGKTKETATEAEANTEAINYTFEPADEPTAPGTYKEKDGLKLTGVPAQIHGYAVESTGTLKINVAGEVTIIVANQGINYLAGDAKSAFVEPYVSVSGATVADLAALGLQIGYETPESGFIKKGAELKLKLGEDGELIGSAAGVEVTKDQWPWVDNYTKVTVKSGKLRVTAADEITLNRIAKADCVDEALSYADVVAPAKKNTVAQLIRDYDGVSADVNLADDFEFKANCWYPLVLPFDATVREISYAFGYAVIDIFQQSNAKTNDVLFILNVGEIKANEPFLIKVDQDIKMSEVEKFYLQNEDPEKARTIKYSANPTLVDAGGNQFVGTYSGKIFAADDHDCYYFPVATNSMAPTAEGKYVRPLGAYLKMTNRDHEAPVRIIIEEANGTMTVIEGVEAGAQAAEGEFAEGWYTITGVKLTAEPTETGTYIYNGKKIFFQAK